MKTTLCPAQQRAYDGLTAALPIGKLFVLGASSGRGRTTVLRTVHEAVGGAYLTMREFVERMQARHPLAFEETLHDWLQQALNESDQVIVDDAHLVFDVVGGGCHFDPRCGFLRRPLSALAAFVEGTHKKLIIGTDGSSPSPIRQRSYEFSIPAFAPEDYEFLCRAYLSPVQADRLDFDKIHRFAPHLDAQQLKVVSSWQRHDAELDTDRFIEFLLSRQLVSNVDLGEVQAVSLRDLHGVDEVLESLETNIILPLENDDLTAELQLKPKCGVLLVGPPGTGKTTVGRALAHRLKSKFFLLDGTCISGSHEFYHQVHHIFEAAKCNVPSILFVDDSDAIFESGEELGLYRYLLTMLDGLESAKAGRVCVMMTAMDVSHLPPALIRSGRIELWLEMKLPDEKARTAILRSCLAPLPPSVGEVDIKRLAAATEQFSGADLKRLVDDGKNLLAADRAHRRPSRSLTDYLLAAVETVQSNKQRDAEAEGRARVQRPRRPVYFDV